MIGPFHPGTPGTVHAHPDRRWSRCGGANHCGRSRPDRRRQVPDPDRPRAQPVRSQRTRSQDPLSPRRRGPGEHQAARESCGCLADVLDDLLPDGCEKAVALTKVEEVMCRANAAAARQS
ncbi:Acb2/Tad1 domain-containing protein [Couchioplanes caeruleus]|uniref:Acb2/Tad1 domain-containing protein n=1 Tax=Couchioplanes caeruleus TaxID=56438 RepID=UPI003CC81175